MNRHYYISNNLDDLEAVENELEASGINSEQIHVLSQHVADVEQHHLHEINSLMEQDVVRSGEIGAVIGVPLAALVLGGAYWLGWTESAAGWMPFIFLAIVVCGFCIWEGGFFGIQVPNTHFRSFKQVVEEENIFSSSMSSRLRSRYWTGLSNITPRWRLLAQERLPPLDSRLAAQMASVQASDIGLAPGD